MGLCRALRDSASFALPMEETEIVTRSEEGKQDAVPTSKSRKVSNERRIENAHGPDLQRGSTESWVMEEP